jgi:urease accessory protein
MVEAIRLGDADLTRPGAAGLNGAVAVATLSLFAPDAEDRLEALRAALPGDGPVRAAASSWDGRLVARFAAPEAWPLRRAVARAVETITQGPLPRVWQV